MVMITGAEFLRIGRRAFQPFEEVRLIRAPVPQSDGPEPARERQSGVNRRVPGLGLDDRNRESEDVDPGRSDQESIENA